MNKLSEKELEQRIEELKKNPYGTLTPNEAAPLLGCKPYSLNIAAKEGRLGTIQHYFAGNALKISKASVLRFLGLLA